MNEWNTLQGTMGAHFNINELIQGRRYFFRACSGNVKGFGAYRISNPTSIIPSSWRDIENKEQRFLGRQKVLDELFTAVRLCRPEDASEIPDSTSHRRNPKKKTTIKQLFSAASKFQRTLRRGIYLACILFCDDKIFVTNEDFIPVIEIDETYPSNLNNDYYWLMKVSTHGSQHAFALCTYKLPRNLLFLRLSLYVLFFPLACFDTDFVHVGRREAVENGYGEENNVSDPFPN
jgi:ankyrin repeat and fibronectin type-III domain-containing protein 1